MGSGRTRRSQVYIVILYLFVSMRAKQHGTEMLKCCCNAWFARIETTRESQHTLANIRHDRLKERTAKIGS